MGRNEAVLYGKFGNNRLISNFYLAITDEFRALKHAHIAAGQAFPEQNNHCRSIQYYHCARYNV